MRLTELRTARGLLFVLGLMLLPGLAMAQACPKYDQPGSEITEVPPDLTAPREVTVSAGGTLNLTACETVPGNGFVNPRPDFQLVTAGPAQAGKDLQFFVDAACDTVLLVNDSTGTWYFSDDEDGGSNPRVVIPAAAEGAFDIWIGTYDGSSCDGLLVFQTFAPGTAPPTSAMNTGMCPDFNLDAPILAYDFAQLATPQIQTVIAGGDMDLSSCPDTLGIGYVIASPDFQIDLTGTTGGKDVEIRVDAVCDAILVVNDASGVWQYNDDVDGTNPVIVLPAAIDGSYDVWVGTLGPDNCDATLQISALGGAPGKGGQQPPAVQGLPDPGNLMAYRDQVGQILSFEVTGSVDGSVYGTDEYTDDSDLSTAAVHAGVLAQGQPGSVTVQIVGPGKGYDASDRNGVSSFDYGKWDGSYVFVVN